MVLYVCSIYLFVCVTGLAAFQIPSPPTHARTKNQHTHTNTRTRKKAAPQNKHCLIS